MANAIVLPVGIDFKTWALQIQEDLPNLTIPLPSLEKYWHAWANQLVAINELADVPVATKIVFPTTEHWRKWANYFVETVYLNN